MKSSEQVFRELIEDDIVFNLGTATSVHLHRDEFANVLAYLLSGLESDRPKATKTRRGKLLYFPEHSREDITHAVENFVKATHLLGVPNDTAVRVLKHTFEPVFAARFEDHREIMTYLYRLSHDERLLERAIRA